MVRVMKNNQKIFYFVEGKCEEKLINSLKNSYLKSGKVKKINVLTTVIKKSDMRNLDKNSNIIIIFDVDVLLKKTVNTKILNESLLTLKKNKYKVITVEQKNNLEDEIVYSTKLKKIEQMFNVESVKDHKVRFLTCKDLLVKLNDNSFDILKIWSRDNGVTNSENESKKIKISKKC